MPATRIRPASTTDLPEILAILNQQIEETVYSFRLAPLDEDAGRRWFELHANPKYPVIVAAVNQAHVSRNEHQLAGWASLSPWSDYEAYDRTAEISVWIRPEFQRQGLGLQLMEALLDQAVQLQLCVILSRIEANNRGSLALHERLGFRVIGTMHRVGEKFGQVLDVVMLERSLE